MALIPPYYLNTVVALGQQNDQNNSPHWYATGFLYGDHISTNERGENYHVYLITNTHVLTNKKHILIRFDSIATDPIELRLLLTDKVGNPVWYSHPNPEIDISIIPINTDFLDNNTAKYEIFRSDLHILTKQDCINHEITEGNSIYLLGFPLKLVGKEKNYVISRGGDIARIRDCLDNKSNTFLVNVPNFPGNSGGPVVTKPEFVHIQGTKSYGKSSLVGIISAYLHYAARTINPQTGETIITHENSGLALAYPVDYIQETIASKKIVAESIPKPID